VDADGQVVSSGGFPEGVIEARAVRVLRARGEEHLHKAGVFGDTVDLLRRLRRQLARDDDRGAQASIFLEPLGALPVVDGARQGNCGVGVVEAVDGVQAVQDGDIGFGCVEGLLLEEREIGTGRCLIGPRAGDGGNSVGS